VKKRDLIVLIAGTLVLAGCGRNDGTEKRTVTDRFGKEAVISARIDRIISTAPSNTEIIVDLGLGDKLAAVDIHSAGIAGVPEDAVRIDFVYPDAETILGLNPGVIIAAGHNITGSGEDPFKLISESGIAVFYIPTSSSIDEIYRDIAFVAEILDVREKGDGLINDMKRQIAEITAAGSGITGKTSVYFEISPAPFLVSTGRNTFLHEMIEIIGGRNIFDDVTGWIAPGAESIMEKNPDVILTNVDYAESPVEEIKSRDGFNTVKAVTNNRIYLIDSNSSSRPSHRIVTALKQMAAAVYPDVYEKQ
jgi:iron complex transport system substrate-binding protein